MKNTDYTERGSRKEIPVSERQVQAGRDWLDLKTRVRAEREKKVLQFLRLNPDSTSDEIYQGCEVAAHHAERFLTFHRRKSDNRMVYRINEKKFAEFFT